jgi:ammonium transporter, Amt family
VLLKIIDAVVGLRVSAEDEYEGLDTSQHGESAYGGASVAAHES